MPTMKWNLEDGGALGRLISGHRSICDSINDISNPPSQQKNGMTEIGCMLSVAISTNPPDILEVICGKCKLPSTTEGRSSRLLTWNRAYNDILYLCEKYAPLDSLEKYDPEKDLSVTGVYPVYVTH